MKRALKIFLSLMICFCLAAAIAESANGSLSREVNMTFGEGNSTSVGTFYFVTCENCSVLKEDHSSLPTLSEDYYAAAGDKLIAAFQPNAAIPKTKYFTQNYTSTPAVTFTQIGSTSQASFVMPASDITISALLADRKSITLDLTEKDTVEAPKEALSTLMEYYTEVQGLSSADPLSVDLNKDGENDISITADSSTPSVTRLAGSDKLTEDVTVTYDPDDHYYYAAYRTFTIKAFRTAPPADSTPPTGPAVGETIVVGGMKYKITGNTTASFLGLQKAKSRKTITIPASINAGDLTLKVTEIGSKALFKDTKVTMLNIGKNVKTIGANACAGCTKLKTVKGGGGVTAIKGAAFQSCKVLTSFPTMNKLQGIGESAFSKCVKLSQITLGSALKTIYANAFNGCKALKTITVKTTKLQSVKSGAFKGINKKAVFKCPKSKLSAYKKLFKRAGAPSTSQYK